MQEIINNIMSIGTGNSKIIGKIFDKKVGNVILKLSGNVIRLQNQ